MSFFNDDPFNNIVKEFFGNSLGRQGGNSFDEDSEEYEEIKKSYGNTGKVPVKSVVDTKKVYFLFDFSGESNIKVRTKELSQKNTGKLNVLEITKNEKRVGEFILPSKIKTKKMEFTLNNGILEVSFER